MGTAALVDEAFVTIATLPVTCTLGRMLSVTQPQHVGAGKANPQSECACEAGSYYEQVTWQAFWQHMPLPSSSSVVSKLQPGGGSSLFRRCTGQSWLRNGHSVGAAVGSAVKAGCAVGAPLGACVGSTDGLADGSVVGLSVGASVGEAVGSCTDFSRYG